MKVFFSILLLFATIQGVLSCDLCSFAFVDSPKVGSHSSQVGNSHVYAYNLIEGQGFHDCHLGHCSFVFMKRSGSLSLTFFSDDFFAIHLAQVKSSHRTNLLRPPIS